VELTQHPAAQNMKMYGDIDGRDSEPNFENFYHNPILVQEERGRNAEFQHEEDVEDPSQCFVDWNSPLTYNTYFNDEYPIKVSFFCFFYSYGQDVEQKVDNHMFNESSKNEISQWGLEKINYNDFLGLENFLSNFPKQNLDVGCGIVEENLIFFFLWSIKN
jgi:hypothetical protein